MRIYQAALQNLGSLQSHRDAVGEDEDQHHVVKELVRYDGLAHLPEPAGGGEQNVSRQTQPAQVPGQFTGKSAVIQPLFTSLLILNKLH